MLPPAASDRAKEMFDHGFSSYMQHAYPADELNPILCRGRSRDADPNNWNVNDVLGNFSLTLVDSLDTLAIMGDRSGFENSVRLVADNVRFDLDSRVQVFEVNIRMLGGLLSAHLLASDPKLGFRISWYNGELLSLAKDLGDRLMPAFDTPTGLPFPRPGLKVNLRRGVLSFEVKEACTAGAGTLLLEFATLSRLTKDPKYEAAARKALQTIWSQRSALDLIGNTMSITKLRWIEKQSGIGAGIDSFFEYLFKAYVLLGDTEYLGMFDDAYRAIMKWIRDERGFVYKNVNMDDGALVSTWIDSLASFFPGLQVLAGDIDSAIKHQYLYFTIWRRFGALPERFDLHSRSPNIASYPLRPELIESTYMLYQATKNPFYLHAGEIMLNDIESAARVSCGFASIKDVRTGAREDRMESFFLSETLKYLYLLFDEGAMRAAAFGHAALPADAFASFKTTL
nr:ER degradation-enhancing alpha-mannosidase-like protein 1 [Polyrhizophydium stewartii]